MALATGIQVSMAVAMALLSNTASVGLGETPYKSVGKVPGS